MDESGNIRVWQMRVYWSETSLGNSTGVVVGASAHNRQHLARMLGYPDTIFLTREDNGGWVGESLSPAGPLEFCTQTFLATDQFFRLNPPPAGQANHTLRVGKREVHLGLKTEPIAGLSWVRWAEAIPKPMTVDFSLDELLGKRATTSDEQVNLPAARLYRAIADAKDLESIRLHPGDVLEFCSRHKLRAICLYCVTAPGSIRLRVFPVSLDGNEDAATGGAVLGLWPLIAKPTSIAPTPYTWRVDQGSGPAHRRGTLYLHHEPSTGAIAVGGKVTLITVGTLGDAM